MSKKPKISPICGCTCHELDSSDPNTVVFRGQQWNAICALKETVRLLDKDKEVIESLSKEVEIHKALLKDLEDIVCPICNDPVGKDWVITKGMFCCITCAQNSNPHI